MHHIKAMLGFAALGLASLIPNHPPHIVVTELYRQSTVDIVHVKVSARGLVANATTPGTFHSPTNAISVSSTNTTAQGPASTASSSQAPFGLLQQSPWSPGDISNVFFGFVASVLGVMTVVLTYRRYRRQLRSQRSGSYTSYLPIMKLLTVWSGDQSVELGVSVSVSSDDNGAIPLEDLPPAYTPVGASTASSGQQGAESAAAIQMLG